MENKKTKIDNVSFHEGKLCLELTNGCMVYIDGDKFSIESDDVINEAPVADVKQRLQKLSTQHCYRAFEEAFNKLVSTLPYPHDTEFTLYEEYSDGLNAERLTLSNGCFEVAAYVDDLFDDERVLQEEFNRRRMFSIFTGVDREYAFQLFKQGDAFLQYNPNALAYHICLTKRTPFVEFYLALDYILALLCLLHTKQEYCKPQLIFALFQTFEQTHQWQNYLCDLQEAGDLYDVGAEYCMFIAGKLSGLINNHKEPLYNYRPDLVTLAHKIGYCTISEENFLDDAC